MADNPPCSSELSSMNPKKRKMYASSDSLDTTLSSPGGKYKLRATTEHGCVFGGKLLSSRELDSSSSASSSSSVRGPCTSKWGLAHINRLNFKKVNAIDVFNTEMIKNPLTTALQQQLIGLLFDPLNSHDGTILNGPTNVDIATRKKLLEACTEVDPVLQQMEAVIDELLKNDINLCSLNEKHRPDVEDYFVNMTTEPKTKNANLSEQTIGQFNNSFAHIFDICTSDCKTETELDKLICSVMHLVELKEGTQRFEIRERRSSRIYFDICGTRVTSETNVLWRYFPKGAVARFTKSFPIVLSENKSHGTGKVGKPTGYHASKTTPTLHKKMTQLIGQCVSFADQSPFETKDYKIVYHVSLMGTSSLVVTRTHVAKSTLKVIKDGCPIPKQDDLHPSYVFESSFTLQNNVVKAFFHIYSALLMFGKLAIMLFSDRASVKGQRHSAQSVRGKLKGVFKRNPSSKPTCPPK